MLRTIALLLSAATLLPAQTGATVEGTVTNRVTGTGIPGVSVAVYTRQAVLYETTTDASGAFRVQGIQPGLYYARYEREGFKGSGPSPGSFNIAAGQSPVRLRLEMTQFVKLRGRVVDNEGKPASNVDVKLPNSAPAKVNDIGEFTIDKIEPGSYTLLATPIGARPIAGQQERTALVPTYYPSFSDSVAAQRIVVRGDADLDGFEIWLQRVPVYRVGGTVRDQLGNPAAGAKVRLLPVLQQQMRVLLNMNGEFLTLLGPGLGRGPEEANAVSGVDGTFEFPSVRSGDWEIAAQVTGNIDSVNFIDTVRLGTTTANVGRSDVNQLEIRLAAPFAVNGTVDWGDATPRQPFISLSPADAPTSFFGPGGQQPNTSFTMPRVSYPASVLLGGTEVFGQRIGLVPGSPPLKISYRAARGSVSGTVENGASASVMLLPQQIQTIAFARVARCKADGAFEMAGVAPGNYYAVAIDKLDPMYPQVALADPGFINKVVTAGVSVRVDQSTTSPLRLRTIRWPE